MSAGPASPPELLTLHAVRLKGVTDAEAAAARFGLDPAVADELLLDAQAYGWVSWAEFAGLGGWSLTDRGRAENERQLAAELDAVADGPAAVRRAHEEFLPLNGRLRRACTDWQLRPAAGAPLAANDHEDADWDNRVLRELARLAAALTPLTAALSDVLGRFAGYDTRFAAALDRAMDGDPAWVDGTGRDSCHTVWFELHEDLIATLGLART